MLPVIGLAVSQASDRRPRLRELELQAAFTRRIGNSLDPPVIEIAAAVEDDVLDALLHRPLGDQGADLGGGVLVRALGLALPFQEMDRTAVTVEERDLKTSRAGLTSLTPWPVAPR